MLMITGVARPQRHVGAHGMQSAREPTRNENTATVTNDAEGATTGTAVQVRPLAKYPLNVEAQEAARADARCGDKDGANHPPLAQVQAINSLRFPAQLAIV